jgi:hypothetical protein
MSFRYAPREPRVEELSKLKLALATFALQLDAFEARIGVRSLMAASKSGPRSTGLSIEESIHYLSRGSD